MGRFLCRPASVLCAFAILPMANASLYSLNYSASKNVLMEAAEKLVDPSYDASSDSCSIAPQNFDVKKSPIFIMSCHSSVDEVRVYMEGDDLFDLNGAPPPEDGYLITLPHGEEPHILYALSCNDNMLGEHSCTEFQVDIYRNTARNPLLAQIGVTSDRLAVLKPNFHPFKHNYNATVHINEPFVISASVTERDVAKVGIEYEGDTSVDSGLPPGTTCDHRHGTHGSVEQWTLPGFKAIGEYKYKLCAYSPFAHETAEYHITVVVTPPFSSKLAMIDVGPHELVPPFTPGIESYHVTLPEHVLKAPLSVKTEDKDASIAISYEGHEEALHDEEEVPRGSAETTVAMHDNRKIGFGEFPQWTQPVTIKVRSADGGKANDYIVNFKQEVNRYSYLKNITPGFTNCKLTPAFDPKQQHYYCEWWWEDEDHVEMPWGEVIPHLDHEKCGGCYILAPSPKNFPKKDLTVFWPSVEREVWRDELPWRRKFVYGEQHIIPFQVVSADKFTNTEYFVTMRRDCPWWMQTWLTRSISQAASTLAIVMAITSATNIMALAKQVQFMTLTTMIDGVPKQYVEFANGLKHINFEEFDLIPWEWLGLPTLEDFLAYEKGILDQLRHHMGIDRVRLMLQYCLAVESKGMDGDLLYPNAMLHLNTDHAEDLRTQLKVNAEEEEEERKKDTTGDAAEDAKGDAAEDTKGGAEEDANGDARVKQRRLLDGSTTDIGSWVSQWFSAPRSRYDDAATDDAKVALRGSGFSVAGSSSVLLDPALPRSYSANASFTLLDKDVRRLVDFGESIMEHAEEEEEEEEELDAEDLEKKIIWSNDDYDVLLKLVLNQTKGLTKEKLRGMYKDVESLSKDQCDRRVAVVAKQAVAFAHECLVFRDMLESTTGVFICVFVTLLLTGSVYYALYVTLVKGNQRRPRILEPGFLAIFVCDYCLITFAKSASKLVFHPKNVDFIAWTATQFSVQIACGAGLLFYPVLFVGYIFYRVLDLDNRKGIVWNQELENYTDPRCQCLKVTLPPQRIPSFIPGIYQAFISHVRACIPVLDEEGGRLDFATFVPPAFVKKEEKDRQGKAKDFEKNIDDKLEEELKRISSTEIAGTALFEHKKKQLILQKEQREGERRRKHDHRKDFNSMLKDVHHKAKAQLNAIKSGDENADEIRPPWLVIANGGDEHGDYEIIDLAEFTNDEVDGPFASQKDRDDQEQLGQEEKLAMISWIKHEIRREKQLLRYNILKVLPDGGCLKPFEPVLSDKVLSDDDDNKKVYVDKWLKSSWDYNQKDEPELKDDQGNVVIDEQGRHRDLNDFMMSEDENCNYIEDDLGQRLIYNGDDNRWWLGFIIPGGFRGGSCDWIQEPEEGWDKWEEEQKAHGKKFADKWQWLYYNEDQPWHGDEEHEETIGFCGCEINKSDIPLWFELKQRMVKLFPNRVPSRVKESEKIEMRKWLWTQLLNSMEIKLKLGFKAAQHEKYDLFPDLEKLAATDFEEVWQQIEIAEPHREKQLDHEKHRINRSELLDFTLMKFEDTYQWGLEEPWMADMDPCAENEYKVMFDHFNFWRTSDDPEMTTIRNENKLVPRTGYYSAAEFMQFPDQAVGCKRYDLSKPDGSLSRVKIDVLMRHVLPLMRYTSGFKLNVERDALDMPILDEYRIVIGEAKFGAQYEYIVERFATLVIIILLASEPAGKLCAVVFFGLLFGNMLHNWRVTINAFRYDERIELEQFEDKMAHMSTTTSDGKVLTPGKKAKAPKKMMTIETMGVAFLEKSVTSKFLQSLTLFILMCGQFGYPAPLTAICCILVSCVTMIITNLQTATEEFVAVLQNAQDSFKGLMTTFRSQKNAIQNWLEGDNIFGFQFYVFEERKEAVVKADRVTMIVPDLGITFEGEIEIPDDLPPEEIRAREMGKKMVPFTMERKGDDDDKRYRSALYHPRYEGDLTSDFFVAFDMEQLMHRKPLPDIFATIHCVNHAASSLSSPLYDSFLTLSKELPNGQQWEHEFNNDPKKVKQVLKRWGEKFEDWLDNRLGAIDDDVTCATSKIKKDLLRILTDECTGNALRSMYMLKIESIDLPAEGNFTIELDGKIGYVQVVYDFEAISRTSAFERRSKFGKFVASTEVNGKGPRVTLDLASDVTDGFSFRIPIGVGRLKFAIWAQDPETETEHLVAISELQEHHYIIPFKEDDAPRNEESGLTDHLNLIDDRHPSTPPMTPSGSPQKRLTTAEVDEFQYDDGREVKMYSTWDLKGRHLEPRGIEKKEENNEDAGWYEWLIDALWKFLTCACISAYFYKEKPREHVTGSMQVLGRAYTQKELKFDKQMMEAMDDLTKQGTSLSTVRLQRQKDRWLVAAEVFGITVSPYDLDSLEKHLKDMEDIGKDMDLVDKKASERKQTRLHTAKSSLESLRSKGTTKSDEFAEMERRLKKLEAENEDLMDDEKKERRRELLEKGFRRGLEGKGVMQNAIQRLKKQIQAARELLEEYEEKQIKPVHESRLKFRKVGKSVTQNLKPQAKPEDQTEEEFMTGWFTSKLVSVLEEYKTNAQLASSQILHYVIMSDQLKPSKSWRPDPIPPHIASVVMREFEDVERVSLIQYRGSPAVIFNREGEKGETAPVLHGKLVYKTGKIAFIDQSGRISFDTEEKPEKTPLQTVYLYWDGTTRWVISTQRGERVPYDQKQGDVKAFMWVQDSAITPNGIHNNWRVYDEKWVEDEKMKIQAKNEANSKPRQGMLAKDLHRQHSVREEGQNDSTIFGFDIKAFFSEIVQLFSRSTQRAVEPELKECLVSLQPKYFEFAWKDEQIERLAGFRSFLLTEFGSYKLAWLYMSRWSDFQTEKGIKNLAALFKESHEAFERAMDQGRVEHELFEIEQKEKEMSSSPSSRAGAMKALPSTALASSASAVYEPAMPPSAANKSSTRTIAVKSTASSASAASTTGDPNSPSGTKDLRKTKRKMTRSKSLKRTATEASSMSFFDPMADKSFALTSADSFTTEADSVDLDYQDLTYLLDFLNENKDVNENGKKHLQWEQLARAIMEDLDRDKGGSINVGELDDIYEEGKWPENRPTCKLKEFRDWCLIHPWYKDFAQLWAELSDGVEVTLDDFTKAMSPHLLKFIANKRQQSNQTTVGVSLLDEENVCTITSAEIQTFTDEASIHKTKVNTVVMRCTVSGEKAMALCRDSKTWRLSVEGKGAAYPETPPVHLASDYKDGDKLPEKSVGVQTTDKAVSVTVRYYDMPNNTKLYFRYGKEGAMFTEVGFYPVNPGAPEEKAEQIFAELDTQMSGGISLKELIPMSGDRLEDVNRSLLKFSVPLSYIQEIRPEAFKTYGVEKKRSIMLKVNPQFANCVEWSMLKTALDAEWQCSNPDSETVHFAMRPEFFNLWKQVIEECQMTKPQEWVRFYDGGYLEHKHMRGVYMRHGYGIQRWNDGKVYVGSWKHHTYDGPGSLYSSLTDYQKVVDQKKPTPLPIYEGNWADGVRNGRGTLHFEQDSKESTSAGDADTKAFTTSRGIRKTYEGFFYNGLFEGSGIITLKDAVAQQVTHTSQNAGRRMKRVMWPMLDPTKIMRFDGVFHPEQSEYPWKEVDAIVRRLSPKFDKKYAGETGPRLKLQELTKQDKRNKSDRYKRYFGTDQTDTQKAGARMPDVALAFYGLKLNGAPAETLHMYKGIAHYSCNSEFEGHFVNGWPQGEGKLTMFETTDAGKKQIASYDGDWERGIRQGMGTYIIEDQFRYEGEWKANRRNGKGKHTIINPEFVEDYGYEIYDGDWEDHKRHGKGVMTYPEGGQGKGKLVYEGDFVKNKRDGKGILKHISEDGKEEHILYVGAWLNDKMYAPSDNIHHVPAWSYTVSPDKAIKRYYFGGLTKEGERLGKGILYSDEVSKDEAFQRAFHAVEEYTSGNADLYRIYDGQWRRNVPHGTGKQWFPDVEGVYDGQFSNGKRHGQGIWNALADKEKKTRWSYKPMPDGEGRKPLPNFKDDKMHGIGIVEDEDHVYEGVIYENGECKMPFTKAGPPITGFDQSVVLGGVINRIKIRRNQANSNKTMQDTAYAETSLLAQGVKKEKVVQQVEDKVEEAQGNGVLVRQPTDLNDEYEEDILVEGGTGVNKVLNGLYFKMAGTFGLLIYKLVKPAERAGGLFGAHEAVSERYLYQNQEKTAWVISEKYGKPPRKLGVGCAAIDSVQMHPSKISKSKKWYVWHNDSGRLRMPGDETDMTPAEEQQDTFLESSLQKVGFDEESIGQGKAWLIAHGVGEQTVGKIGKKGPIDFLTMNTVVGFEIYGADPGFWSGFASSHMLRIAKEFYRRPVYEAEDERQYLYWIPGSYGDDSNAEGDTPEKFQQRVEEGLEAVGIDAPVEAEHIDNIFAQPGAWVIAEEVGILPGSPDCAAWVVDSGNSPHQIPEERSWVVRDYTPGAALKFVVNPEFKLLLEMGDRSAAADIVGLLDGEEEPVNEMLKGTPTPIENEYGTDHRR